MPLYIKYTKIREKNQIIRNKKSLVHKNACIEKRSWQKFCIDNIKLLSVGFFKILIFTVSGFFFHVFFTNIYSYIYWKNPKGLKITGFDYPLVVLCLSSVQCLTLLKIVTPPPLWSLQTPHTFFLKWDLGDICQPFIFVEIWLF